jgi:hypothetical protein
MIGPHDDCKCIHCFREHKRRAKELAVAVQYGKPASEEELKYIEQYYGPIAHLKINAISVDTETDPILWKKRVGGVPTSLALTELLQSLQIKQLERNEMYKYRIKKNDEDIFSWNPSGDPATTPKVSVANNDEELMIGLNRIPVDQRKDFTIAVFIEETPQNTTKEKIVNNLSVSSASEAILNRALSTVRDEQRGLQSSMSAAEQVLELCNNLVNGGNANRTKIIEATLLEFQNSLDLMQGRVNKVRIAVSKYAIVLDKKI